MRALPFAADDRRDGVVGLAFAMKHVAQLLLMCDGHDIGLSIDGQPSLPDMRGASAGQAGDRNRPRRPAEAGLQAGDGGNIFIYDNYPGGIGFSRPLYEMHGLLLERTRELISGCPCESGCPSCVGPEGHTGPHAKAVASRILETLLNQHLDQAS